MKKAIVTTTINAPTEALKKFIKIADADEWHLFIVGDQKTDDKPYYDIDTAMDCVTYLDCEAQEGISKELSDLIGWNCIQRRNFGLIAAYQWGAEVIATVDDDNIPYDNWGKNLKVNTELSVLTYELYDQIAFDPLSPVFSSLWHRGFPYELLDKRRLMKPKLLKRKVLVQADFWDDDPDVDAICRIAMAPSVKFNQNMSPYAADKISPFNSQNTFLSKELFPTYFLFPHIGRMDDIWASYFTQSWFPGSVIYSRASVHQARNPHDLYKDLEAEMLGYRHNLEVVEDPGNILQLLPKDSLKAYEVYKELFNEKAN